AAGVEATRRACASALGVHRSWSKIPNANASTTARQNPRNKSLGLKPRDCPHRERPIAVAAGLPGSVRRPLSRFHTIDALSHLGDRVILTSGHEWTTAKSLESGDILAAPPIRATGEPVINERFRPLPSVLKSNAGLSPGRWSSIPTDEQFMTDPRLIVTFPVEL
ncbi:MAG: hypothetical protein QOG89_3682, partial [Thermomicrobiales bacterium]|nr:hypothetical protein [Thermomicrobiales bacterium]